MFKDPVRIRDDICLCGYLHQAIDSPLLSSYLRHEMDSMVMCLSCIELSCHSRRDNSCRMPPNSLLLGKSSIDDPVALC